MRVSRPTSLLTAWSLSTPPVTASELKSNGESDLLWIGALFRVEPGRLRPVLPIDERLSMRERVSVVGAVLCE
jgi:hypothetical protein